MRRRLLLATVPALMELAGYGLVITVAAVAWGTLGLLGSIGLALLLAGRDLAPDDEALRQAEIRQRPPRARAVGWEQD